MNASLEAQAALQDRQSLSRPPSGYYFALPNFQPCLLLFVLVDARFLTPAKIEEEMAGTGWLPFEIWQLIDGDVGRIPRAVVVFFLSFVAYLKVFFLA